MKTRYEIVAPSVPYVLGQIVLYGDRDDDTDKLLMAMIREAFAVASVRGGNQEILLRRQSIDI